eukprot:8951664-Pyramimonas_sp.AAC.1
MNELDNKIEELTTLQRDMSNAGNDRYSDTEAGDEDADQPQRNTTQRRSLAPTPSPRKQTRA